MSKETILNLATDIGVKKNAYQTTYTYTNAKKEQTKNSIFNTNKDYVKEYLQKQQLNSNPLFQNNFTMSEHLEMATLLLALEEVEYVVSGATLMCDGCVNPSERSTLRVTSQAKFYIQSQLVATKDDKLMDINITRFNCECKFTTNKKCVPLVTWLYYSEDKKVKGKEILLKRSVGICTAGTVGRITIEKSGQEQKMQQITNQSNILLNYATVFLTKEEAKKHMGAYLSEL